MVVCLFRGAFRHLQSSPVIRTKHLLSVVYLGWAARGPVQDSWPHPMGFVRAPWKHLTILYLDTIIYYMMFAGLLPTGRWKLLKALWRDGASGSVRTLANQNGMSYSNTHAELKRLERASLACSQVVGNALVFEANREHPATSAIEELVRTSADAQPGKEPPRPDQTMANLASLGAPVSTESTPDVDLDPEEAVAQGLRLTHLYPTLARAYPVLLARNRGRLNLERLKQIATELNEKQTLGFFLELTASLANDRQLRSFAQTLKDRRVKKVRDFFEGPQGKYSQRLANQRTPPVANRWHFRMNMDMDNFRHFYSKFRTA